MCSTAKRTGRCARPEQINNVGVVTDVCQHLQLRHQSLLLYCLVFLCE